MTDAPSDSPSGPAPQRPRPKYGEYATPQEQAEIIAKSLPPVSPVLQPRDQEGSRPVRAVPEVHPGTTVPMTPIPSTARPPRRWDRILSIALLAYALFSTLSGFAQYGDLPAVVQSVYDIQGVGTFASSPLAEGMGPAIVIVNVAIFVLTVFLTVRRLQKNRLAFWIPLVAGTLSIVVTAVLLGIVIFNDPAFRAFASLG